MLDGRDREVAYGQDVDSSVAGPRIDSILPCMDFAIRYRGRSLLSFRRGRLAGLARLADSARQTIRSSAREGVFGLFPLSIAPGGDRLRIDDYASVDLLPGAADYRLTLTLRDASHTLLVTDDEGMMCDFVGRYVLARIECRPALREFPR